MTDTVRHRGPDDEGYWLDLEAGVALGHRRLSIIDLSPLGSQPMVSESGRFVLVYNGEIYNYLDLRDELESLPQGCRFRSTSDTEVMLGAFERWGVMASLKRFVGMFAFAAWDRQERQLFLARDRMGEKPLYYGLMGNTLLFGSELKAFRRHPSWQGEINRDALALYMRHMYIPGPYSIYSDVFKLPPGTVLCPTANDTRHLPAPEPYWSLYQVAEEGRAAPFVGDEVEAADELETLLKDSVRRQMIADVPLGAFLSGGIDSSTVVALMQAQSTQPIKTFSIGFEERNYNEAPYARAVAEHLGTDHTELYVTPQQTIDVIPRIPALWDEPFADSSQIPTFLVAQLARQHVTVSLSGDGGDELFAGYRRYLRSLQISQANGIPEWQQALLHRIPGKVYGGLLSVGLALGATKMSQRLRQYYAISQHYPFDAIKDYHRWSLSHWPEPETLVLGATEPQTIVTDKSRWPNLEGLIERLTFFDMSMYLPDDILVKIDRASMGVSLESRVPLLDHRVVEFSQRLPVSMKIRDHQSKWILRQVLHRYVPKELIERPKMGFGVPIDTWLRTELRDWAEHLLDERRLRSQNLLNVDLIRKTWNQHLSGLRNNHYLLWDVLMFQAWEESLKQPLFAQ